MENYKYLFLRTCKNDVSYGFSVVQTAFNNQFLLSLGIFIKLRVIFTDQSRPIVLNLIETSHIIIAVPIEYKHTKERRDQTRHVRHHVVVLRKFVRLPFRWKIQKLERERERETFERDLQIIAPVDNVTAWSDATCTKVFFVISCLETRYFKVDVHRST